MEDNPVTTNPRISIRTIVQPRRKVRCYCNDCNRILVDHHTKIQHELQELIDELSEEVSANSSQNINKLSKILENTEIQESKILENTEIQENYSAEVLDNPGIQENMIGESASNEQNVVEVQLLSQKCDLRYISARIPSSHLATEDDQIDDTYENRDDEESNRDDKPTNDSSENYEDYSCPSFEPF